MCPAVGDAERVGRRHTWVPPYRGISKGAVKRGVGDADPYAGQGGFYENVIPRSEATWESVFPCVRGAVQGYYGLPHQPAGWFAMTGFFGSAARIERRGVGDAPPTKALQRVRCIIGRRG